MLTAIDERFDDLEDNVAELQQAVIALQQLLSQNSPSNGCVVCRVNVDDPVIFHRENGEENHSDDASQEAPSSAKLTSPPAPPAPSAPPSPMVSPMSVPHET